MKKISIILIMCLLLSSCSSNLNNTTSTVPKEKINKTASKEKINKYEFVLDEVEGDINYKIYSNKLLDTYIIAAALSLDFNSKVLLPENEYYSFYKKTKEYFAPYKEHTFMRHFDKYLRNDDININVAKILLDYSNGSDYESLYKYVNNNSDLKRIFSNKDEVEKFINDFEQFYIDTKAEEFFDSISQRDLVMKEYYDNNKDKAKMLELISEMESYIGVDKNIKKTINYHTVVTTWRPYLGSYLYEETEEGINRYSFESLLRYNSKRLEEYDVYGCASNSIRDYLHILLNTPVYNNIGNINKYNKFSNKEELTKSSFYVNKSWDKITEAYFVRAIQGRIFKNVIGENKANSFLGGEITFGGFPYLNGLYVKLEAYENNRRKYKNIDKFIPVLIKELYSNSK
ncbi:DUF4932 domain-containing protein [Oceanirhabdus sp. W0125-5]|uniref:DUF4932 domain-containing protein n=1 Tax=Oceanirhabdus sp. W0125-5 TaxID=2999116 RepID=UPI0022F2B20B|nr:DUF4932 domain-containing protein [Oceanirhabdus sp. W0125-5]WBW96739.1 DUF4932 domain-containing protein [Oceanirhabdus sp. W0125-5]